MGGNSSAGQQMVQQLNQSPMVSTGAYGSWSWEQMQREYTRQRRAVLDELRLAKDEAEAERARIMSRIGKTLGNSRWRAV
jgi:hypothetical protein